METVVVKSVNKREVGKEGKPKKTLYTLTLEDGREAETFSEKLAKAAMATRDEPVEADIRTEQNGNFTNVRVYQVGDVKLEPRGKTPTTNGKEVSGDTITPTPVKDTRQETIQWQWAYGRAAEAANVVFNPETADYKSLVRALADFFHSEVQGRI